MSSGSGSRAAGSYSAGGEGGEGGRRTGIPWWLLLLGLALLLGLLFFACARGGDSDATGAAATATDDVAASGGTAGQADPDASATAGASEGGDSGEAAGGSGATRESGTVAIAGTSVLPGAAAQITGTAGQSASGTEVVVESVVSDEGFWVGDSVSDRIFIRLRTGGEESPFQVQAGQTVSFEGTVAQNPSDLEEELGVTAEEGADLLQQQGSHIEVDEVQLDQEA